MDRDGATVTVPEGVGFDPGGIGKGFAADLLLEEVLRAGAAGACANVGGDLRVGGEAPGGGAWSIGIEHPSRPGATMLVGVCSGAVATSTRARRTWALNGERRHHLIDPRTGARSQSRVLSATAIAAEGWQAEVVAEATFLAGVSEGLYLFASTNTDGLLIDDHECVFPSAGFERYAAHSRPTLLAAGGSPR